MITALVERDPFSFCGGEDSGVRRCRGAQGSQGSVATSPHPPSPPLANQIGGRERRAEAGEKRCPPTPLILLGTVTPAPPREEAQTQRITRKQETSCPTGTAPRQSWRLYVSYPCAKKSEGGSLCVVPSIEQGASSEGKSGMLEARERNIIGWSLTHFPLSDS